MIAQVRRVRAVPIFIALVGLVILTAILNPAVITGDGAAAILVEASLIGFLAAGQTNRIIMRHIVPNIVSAVVVEVSLLVGTAIVLESTLSFLGLGVQRPIPTLGNLVYEEKGNIDSEPLRVLLPGLFVVAIVLCVNFLGDGLRDALDPKTKVES